MKPGYAGAAEHIASLEARIAELEAGRDSIRNEALEEAAVVLDGMATDKGDDYAAAIRALKGGKQ